MTIMHISTHLRIEPLKDKSDKIIVKVSTIEATEKSFVVGITVSVPSLKSNNHISTHIRIEPSLNPESKWKSDKILVVNQENS
jgi:hypothetical protein